MEQTLSKGLENLGRLLIAASAQPLINPPLVLPPTIEKTLSNSTPNSQSLYVWWARAKSAGPGANRSEHSKDKGRVCVW